MTRPMESSTWLAGLQLSLLQSLMEEFGTHVLEACEHVFAISFPVFINQFFDFCPVAPSSIDGTLLLFACS